MPTDKIKKNYINKRKPIYVSDPNDPRIQSYQDSLILFNDYNVLKKELIKNNYINKGIPNLSESGVKTPVDEKTFIDFIKTGKGKDGLLDKFKVSTKNLKKADPKKIGNLYSVKDFYTEQINENLPSQLFSNKIKPKSKEAYKFNSLNPFSNNFMDHRLVYNYENVNPEQPYIYKKVEKKKKKEEEKRIPIITTDRRKVQAYNDSSFIKKNFSIFPKPKGYDQALKRVGQDPSADYFPAPEQPYILKKEKKKIKKDIVPVPVPVKESIPKDTIPVVKPIIEPVVKPQVEKEPEPTVVKKLPGGTGPFARYPKKQGFFNKIKDSFNGLMQNRMVNGRNVNNITVTGPKFISGAKSVKQYRGDENLPEAKNGMKKNCGCKHSKSKYKYQGGNKNTKVAKVAQPIKSKGEVMEDLYALMGEATGNRPEKLLRSAVIVDKNTNKAIIRAKNSKNNKTVNVLTGQNRDVNAKDENLLLVPQLDKNPKGRVTPTGYYKLDPNWVNEDDKKNYHGNVSHLDPIQANGRKAPKARVVAFHETYDPKVRNPLYGTNKANISYGCVNINPKDYKYAINNLENKNDTLAVFDSRRAADRDLLSRYQAVTQKAKGANALTIPEGSAIVTANGGKNKQALMAYKKGNYKLLNKIIDDMPEDNVDKAQAGRQSLEARYKELGELTGPLSAAQQKEFDDVKSQLTEDEYDIYDDKRIAEKFGQKYDVDKAKWKSSLKGGKLNLKEDAANANYRESLRDPKVLKAAIAAGNVKVDAKGNISYTSVGESAPGKQEFLGTSKKGTLPELKGSEDLKKGPPKEIPPPGTTDTGEKKGFNMPSMAEIAARSSILGQGVEGVPENYLKLGRYNYVSQLPKTLQENALAEQAGRNTARDIVAGDAGRYLAQTGSLSASRMKLNNEAVIQDTLARQDILNKNVDLGNTEAQINTGLKNQYAALRGQARSAYNDQLVGLGQRIDSATETAQEMSNQKSADAQRLQVLKDLGLNYEYQNVNGLNKLVPKNTNTTSTTTPPAPQAKGNKRLKTYKRK